MSEKIKCPTLFEMCIRYMCTNAKHFAQIEQNEVLMKGSPQQKKRKNKVDISGTSADFGSPLQYIPTKPSQILLNNLSHLQQLTFPLLLQLSQSGITQLNLCMNGRVRNEWMILIRDMRITHLNLSHCLITNDCMLHFKKKPACSNGKKSRSIYVAANQSSSGYSSNNHYNGYTNGNGSSKSSPKEKNGKQKQRRNSRGSTTTSRSPQVDDNASPKTPRRSSSVAIPSSKSAAVSIPSKTPPGHYGLAVMIPSTITYDDDDDEDDERQVSPPSPLGASSPSASNADYYPISETLTSLNLSYVRMMNNEGIAIVAKQFRGLKSLNLEGCVHVSNKSMESIGRNLQSLTALNVKRLHKISAHGIASLSALKNLEALNISECDKMTSESLMYLSRYNKKLTYLNIRGNARIDQEGLDCLSKLSSLKTLDMLGLPKIDSLSFLTQIPGLTSLNISHTPVKDENLLHLSKLTELKCLNMSGCKNVTDVSLLEIIPHLEQLSFFDVSATNITDITLFRLQKLKNLQKLNISFCSRLTDIGMLCLAGKEAPSDSSEHIIMNGTSVAAGLDELYVRSLPQITSKGWEALLGQCSSLDVLDISDSFSAETESAEGLAKLVVLTKNVSDMTRLSVLLATNCNLLDDNFFKALSNLSLTLSHLDISNTSITDNGMLYIAKFVNLVCLTMRDETKLTKDGYSYLQYCIKLEELDISSAKITNEELKNLSPLVNLCTLSLMNCTQLTSSSMKCLQNMVHLQTLNLYGIALTDSGINLLKNLTSLNTLRLSESHLITDNGYAVLHDLPNLIYLKQRPLASTNSVRLSL